MQGFTAPFIYLVLRANHLAHDTIACIVASDVGGGQDDRALRVAVLVVVRGIPALELDAPGKRTPVPAALPLDPDLDDTNPLALAVAPHQVVGPVVECIAQAVVVAGDDAVQVVSRIG